MKDWERYLAERRQAAVDAADAARAAKEDEEAHLKLQREEENRKFIKRLDDDAALVLAEVGAPEMLADINSSVWGGLGVIKTHKGELSSEEFVTRHSSGGGLGGSSWSGTETDYHYFSGLRVDFQYPVDGRDFHTYIAIVGVAKHFSSGSSLVSRHFSGNSWARINALRILHSDGEPVGYLGNPGYQDRKLYEEKYFEGNLDFVGKINLFDLIDLNDKEGKKRDPEEVRESLRYQLALALEGRASRGLVLPNLGVTPFPQATNT